MAWGQKQGRSLLHSWWHAEEAAEGHSLPLPCPLAIPLGISPSGPLASLLFLFVCLFLKNIYLTGQGLGYTRQDLSVVACRDLLLLFFFFLVAVCEIQFLSDQGWNPGPLHWELRVATGPPGKALLGIFGLSPKSSLRLWQGH